MAQLGWIDFSNDHRERVFSVIDMLTEKGILDELGVGIIRDSIADLLVPGISTIQTRPKYFILLPQIFLRYLAEYKGKSKYPSLKSFLKETENAYMHKLAKAYNYEERNGVIGVTVARGKGELARKASSIYWNGLKTHGIVQTHLSLKEYLQKNDLSNTWTDRYQTEDGAGDDGDVIWANSFGLTIPLLPDTIDTELPMELTRTESEFLRDKFIDCNRGKKGEENLLRQILLSPNRMNVVSGASEFLLMAEALLEDPELPLKTKQLLQTAIHFDFLMRGAHIRYNIQLQRAAGVQQFDDLWLVWLVELQRRRELVAQFDLYQLFSTIAPRTPQFTRQFLISWKSRVLEAPMNEHELDALVRKQEIRNKGSKAKLQSTAGMEVDGWVGIERLEYRFGTLKSIIIDLKKGLSNA